MRQSPTAATRPAGGRGESGRSRPVQRVIKPNTNCPGEDLSRANLRRTNLRNTDFSNANLRRADFLNADFENTDFRGATFCHTTMPDGTEKSDPKGCN